jgi:hypothetical protein
MMMMMVTMMRAGRGCYLMTIMLVLCFSWGQPWHVIPRHRTLLLLLQANPHRSQSPPLCPPPPCVSVHSLTKKPNLAATCAHIKETNDYVM